MLEWNLLSGSVSGQKLKRFSFSFSKKLFVVAVSVLVFWISDCSVGYCYTLEDVDSAVAKATTGLCTAEKEQFSSNNQIGFKIYQVCLHPKNVMTEIHVGLGNDCLDGYGYHFSGGPHAGFGCNGSPRYWASACDNTGNNVAITSTTPVYRTCYAWSVKVYCDGTESEPSGHYLDLGMDCTAMTKSPCPSIINTEDNCHSRKLVDTLYPVCDGSDPCCGSKDPCCGGKCCPIGPGM